MAEQKQKSGRVKKVNTGEPPALAMSQETVRLSNNFVRERHDSYKTLVGHVAEQLSEEDLRNIFWYVDAPEKLRTGPALDVLESMKRQGKFSEFNVQFLSDLLKKISRIDLMDKVDLYSQQYGMLVFCLTQAHAICDE